VPPLTASLPPQRTERHQGLDQRGLHDSVGFSPQGVGSPGIQAPQLTPPESLAVNRSQAPLRNCWTPGELPESPAGQPTAGFGLEESRLPCWQPVQSVFGSPVLASDFLCPHERRRTLGTPALSHGWCQKSCPGTAALCRDVKSSLNPQQQSPCHGHSPLQILILPRPTIPGHLCTALTYPMGQKIIKN